jgi:hypothetical protein
LSKITERIFSATIIEIVYSTFLHKINQNFLKKETLYFCPNSFPHAMFIKSILERQFCAFSFRIFLLFPDFRTSHLVLFQKF